MSYTSVEAGAIIERVKRSTRNPDVLAVCEIAEGKVFAVPAAPVPTPSSAPGSAGSLVCEVCEVCEHRRSVWSARMKRYRNNRKQAGKRIKG